MQPSDPDRHPLVVAVAQLVDRLLVPQAEQVDRGVVPRSHLLALAEIGVLAMSAPATPQRPAVPGPVVRRVQELLAGADAATWFVQVQHHFPVRALAERVACGDSHWSGALARLTATGSPASADPATAIEPQVAGIAFSHLRRWPRRPVRAEWLPAGTRAGASGGGGGGRGGRWRLDGVAPWYTGWGINDVALVAGASDQAEAVFALIPAVASSQVKASAPMQLAALQSTVTVALELDGLVVDDADVVLVQPLDQWQRDDDRVTVNVNPAFFGVAERAIGLLARAGADAAPTDPTGAAARGVAARLAAAVLEVKDEAYALIDEADPDEFTERRLQLRARAQRLMTDATTALVIAGAGRSMAADHPAQRLAREALFLLIQAQTVAGRHAALQEWAISP